MRLLLDTHIYLWWLADDPQLSATVREAIASPDALVHVSAATIWEAEIKRALGRLALGQGDLVAEIAANGFAELPVAARHGVLAAALPPVHRDPFDRMLVAQARSEHLRLVTADATLEGYGVDMLAP